MSIIDRLLFRKIMFSNETKSSYLIQQLAVFSPKTICNKSLSENECIISDHNRCVLNLIDYDKTDIDFLVKLHVIFHEIKNISKYFLHSIIYIDNITKEFCINLSTFNFNIIIKQSGIYKEKFCSYQDLISTDISINNIYVFLKNETLLINYDIIY